MIHNVPVAHHDFDRALMIMLSSFYTYTYTFLCPLKTCAKFHDDRSNS